MRLYLTLTIYLLLSRSIILSSQKLGKLDDLTVKDFSNFKSGTILSQKTLVTFPYKQDNGNAGAKDEYFELLIESIIRIKISKNDSIQRILGLPKSYNSSIKINSIKYFFQNGQSIDSRKTKESVLTLSSDDIGEYIIFSQVLQDSTAIIEVNYKLISKIKDNILFLLDKNYNYIDYNFKIFIPEIYTYNILTPSKCIKYEIDRGLPGPQIGYDPGTGLNKELLSKALADVFKKEFNREYKPVYCKTNLFTFYKDGVCNMSDETNKEILRLALIKTVEINNSR